MTLPNFVVIGAPKAATTWLSDALRGQPDVFMPGPELHFFNRNHDRGVGWYAAHFADARPGQLVGEKSASYLADPEVPRRLRRVLPDARLVVQLRNPVERAYSDYCMLYRRGEVGADAASYLDPARAGLRRFLDDGLYARHLDAFLALFPRERIKVILYDDIRRDADGVFDDVTGFLGLSDPTRPEALCRRVKDKERAMLPLPLRRALRPLKGAARPLRGRPWFQAAHRLLARPTAYPPLDGELRRRMAAHYLDDVRALERLLGRDLGAWLRADAGRA